MKVSVIGTGYVGLVAGACFADAGNTVWCVDVDARKIEGLKKGIIPIYEPGLEDLVLRNVKESRLHFTTSTAEAVQASEIVFLAVGTPPLPSGEPDLSYLKSAVEAVARSMNGPKILVNKSTVPIGTSRTVARWASALTKHPVHVVSNPEFLKEGSALEDFLKPDRVVIGTTDPQAYEKMAELYAPFVRQGNPVIHMDPVSAEMTKYACNAFLATRISFMNELAVLSEALGGDIEQIRKGMTTDVRIGKHFLYAGVGYGGSCFPKDVSALVSTARKAELPLGIVEAAEKANARQKKHLLKHIHSRFNGALSGKTFAFWGLAFKPNTDDMREAPALTLAEELTRLGARVSAFDPVAMERTKEILGERISYASSAMKATEGADALVIVTEWNEFRTPDFEALKRNLKNPVIFDGRNVFEPARVEKQGFEYYGVGRGRSVKRA
jgi:UDPglucose 6-dehydrogenase